MMDKKTKRAHLGNHSSTGSVAPTLTPTPNNAAPNFLPGATSTTPLYHHHPYAHHPHANPGAAAGIFLAAGPGSGPGNHLNLGPATLLAYNMPSPYYPSGAAAAAAHLIGQPFGLGAVSATLLPNNSSVMTSFTAPRLATPQHSALYHFPPNAATALFPIYNPPPPNYKTITPVATIPFAPSSYAGDMPSSGLQNNGLPPPASTTTTPNQDNSVAFGTEDVSGGYGARGKQVNGNAAGSTPPNNSNNLPNAYYQQQQVNQQQHNVGPLTGANNIAAGYHHHQQQYTSGPLPGSQPIMMSVAMLNGAVGGNLVSQQSSPSAFVGAGVSSSPMIANNGSLIYNNNNSFVTGPYATTNGPGALRQGIARNNGNGGNNQMDIMVGSMMAAASTYNNSQHHNKKLPNNAPVANYYYINGPLGGGAATSYVPVSHAPAYNLTTPPLAAAAAAAALKYAPTATSDSQTSLGIGETLALVNAPLPPTSYMANGPISQQMASGGKEGLLLPFYDSVKKGSSSKIHISDTSGKVYSPQDLAKDENVDSARATEFREAVASKAREPEDTSVDHDAVKALTELVVAEVQQITPSHMDNSAGKGKISATSYIDTLASKEIPDEREGQIPKLDNQPVALQEPAEVYKNTTQAAALDKSATTQAVFGDKTADDAAAEAIISDGERVIFVDSLLTNDTAAPVISITVPKPITIKENRVTMSKTIEKLPISHEPVVLGVKGEGKPPPKAKTDDVATEEPSVASLGRESPMPVHIETVVIDGGTPRLMEMDFINIKPKPVHQGVYKYSKDELFAIRQMLDISYFPPILRSFSFFSFDNKKVTIGAPTFNKRQLPNGFELNRYPFGNAYNRPSGRDFPPTFELPSSAQPKIELTTSKNAWVSLQQRRSDMDSEKFASEELLGKVKAILNKMAPNNFAVLLEDFKNLSSKIDTQEKVQGVVAVIFKKALLEPIYAEAYAVFLRALANFCSQNQTEFKPISLLLAMSQKEFYAINNDTKGEKEKEWEAKIAEAKDENAKKILEEDYNEFLLKGRDRYLGNIKFLSELYKQSLISSRILCDCLQILFNAKTEIAYEGMCNLMRFAGKAYSDSVVERGETNIITGLIASMRELINDKSLPSRIKYMMVDILELEENKWVPRRDEDLPKTFEQINKEIARENEENKKIAANSNKKFYKQHQQRDYNRPDSPVISPMLGTNTCMGGGGNAFDAGKILASRPSSNLQRAQAFNIDGMKLAPTLRWGRGSSSGSKNQNTPANNTQSPTTTQGGYKSTANERLLLAPPHLAPATRPPSILAKNSFGALASSGPLSPSSPDPTPTDDFIPASLRPNIGGNISKRVVHTSDISSAPPPLVKTVYPHEEAVQKYKSCLKSYFITNVDQDYLDCCQTLRHQPTPLFACDQILHFVFDQHAAERDKYAGALLLLVSNKICPLEDVVRQMSDFLQNPDDILEDYPLLFQYLAHIVVPLALNAPAYGVSMDPKEFVVRYLKPLLTHLSNEERKMFIDQMIDYLQTFAAQSSTTFSSDVVDSYRLAISNLSPMVSRVAEQPPKSNHPFDQRLQQLLFASAASDDQKLYDAIAEETRSYLNSLSSISDDVVDSRIIPELTAALDCALTVGVGTGEPSVARAQKILDIVSNAIDDTTIFGHENKRRLRDAILKLSATNNITRLDNDTTAPDTQETTRSDPLTASS